jgi:hypothetical protein
LFKRDKEERRTVEDWKRRRAVALSK